LDEYENKYLDQLQKKKKEEVENILCGALDNQQISGGYGQ
jgi:hypothetical protein